MTRWLSLALLTSHISFLTSQSPATIRYQLSVISCSVLWGEYPTPFYCSLFTIRYSALALKGRRKLAPGATRGRVPKKNSGAGSPPARGGVAAKLTGWWESGRQPGCGIEIHIRRLFIVHYSLFVSSALALKGRRKLAPGATRGKGPKKEFRSPRSGRHDREVGKLTVARAVEVILRYQKSWKADLLQPCNLD